MSELDIISLEMKGTPAATDLYMNPIDVLLYPAAKGQVTT